ncbi:ankyrin repeat domain-containing protein [Candidatus Rariloculus sp.]|uniref:ankyrin repeat domain-containing protein n=1 Tax=Candidatus Rariloculus sp. TaxID=3101265 RepID=UPI003D12AA7E
MLRTRSLIRLTAAAALAALPPLALSDGLNVVEAMKHRDVASVRASIAEGADVNAQDAETATALHWAAHWNDIEAVRLLLGAGADPNASNRFGVTPLHEAAIVRNAAMMAAMLEAGGDPNAAFGEGESVLMTAARTGNAEIVRMILEHGGDATAAESWHGQTALMWAALDGHPDVARLLIEHGADPNRASTAHDWISIEYSSGNVPKTRDIGGLTPLHFAARHGRIEVADVLLEAGADSTAVEPMYQLTPLQTSIVNGHYAFAAHLIDRGADVNDGSLYLTIDTRHLGFYAQRPNPPDKDRGVSNLDVVDLLLARGADADHPYDKGIPERTVAGQIEVPPGATPLDRAAAANDLEVIRRLVAQGADAGVATEDGTTPLMLLTGFKRSAFGPPPQVAGDAARYEAIGRLLEAGADVNAAQVESGNTAVHYAAMRGAGNVVALLTEHGASLDIENAEGMTAAGLAADAAAGE